MRLKNIFFHGLFIILFISVVIAASVTGVVQDVSQATGGIVPSMLFFTLALVCYMADDEITHELPGEGEFLA